MARFWKEEQRIMRWKTDNLKLERPQHDIARSRTASIDVSKRILEDLRRDILKLQNQREYPFANFDCEESLAAVDGYIALENEQMSTLPSLKLFSRHICAPLEEDEGPGSLLPESNMLILKLLEFETPGTVQGRSEDNESSDDIPIDDQEQDRLAFMLTVRLLYVAFESFISPDGSVRLPSGIILSTSRYPGISAKIFEYIHGLKIDLIHAGLSSQLSEADAEIEAWLPKIMEALQCPQNSVEDVPRQLQRLVATLREVQFRIRCSGFINVHYAPRLSVEQQPEEQPEHRLPRLRTIQSKKALSSLVSRSAG
jgi:hypothetical protein